MATERREEHAEWWYGACIYKVQRRCFVDSEDDGEGDLIGFPSRMDCLAVLGADATRITPFFPPSMHDSGYDSADDRQVDPRSGTLQDPEGIQLWPYDQGRDGARAPFPWDDTDQLRSLRNACTWLPCEPFHAALSVARQGRLSGSIPENRRALIGLRPANAALRYVSFEPAEHEKDWFVSFHVHEEQELMCAVNFPHSLRSVGCDQVTVFPRERQEAALPAHGYVVAEQN